MKTSNYNLVVKNLLLYIVILFILFYFIYHIFVGERGISNYFNLRKELSELNFKLDQLQLQRLNLEHRVKLLSTKSLDLDILDEEARKKLDVARKNEIIFYTDDEKK